MEKLSVKKRTEASKMSTERLRARLIKAGYDEDEVVEMDRNELLVLKPSTYFHPRYPNHPRRQKVEQ